MKGKLSQYNLENVAKITSRVTSRWQLVYDFFNIVNAVDMCISIAWLSQPKSLKNKFSLYDIETRVKGSKTGSLALRRGMWMWKRKAVRFDQG